MALVEIITEGERLHLADCLIVGATLPVEVLFIHEIVDTFYVDRLVF